MIVDPPRTLAHEAGSVRVQKRPIPVQVSWMRADGICQTREGAVRYRAGDPVLTGVDGEQWTMPAASFLATYQPVAPLRLCEDGHYIKKALPVWVQRLVQSVGVKVSFQDSMLHDASGDWLVQYGPGDFGIVSAAIFDKTYDILGTPA
jgi:hypothetical protein